MKIDIEKLKARFLHMTNAELVDLYFGDELVDEVKTILLEEINKRNIDVKWLRGEHEERLNIKLQQERQFREDVTRGAVINATVLASMLLGLSVFMFGFGIYEKNETVVNFSISPLFLVPLVYVYKYVKVKVLLFILNPWKSRTSD